MSSSSIAGLSASVTRILSLTGFPKELKTKDIQQAFSEYESVNGGFKIKWKDDTSLLIVFQDPGVAKRAYLQTIASPPAILTSPAGAVASIRPYDGPDAQSIIQNVNSRGQHNSNPSRAHNARSASVSFPPNRTISAGGPSAGQPISNRTSQHIGIPEHPSSIGREHSPTLPSLPTHPTLNYLINSSLAETVAGGPQNGSSSDPAVLTTSLQPDVSAGGPRIGDPGKRMLGAALGMRHPSLGPRVINGGSGSPGSSPSQGGGVDQAMREVQKAMGGLTVAE
ncbi:hypothetical protein H0H93_005738 [Arthromyces matolae]|nr:hypothetical protein H0H93_005738 [Arthromyces matolae]